MILQQVRTVHLLYTLLVQLLNSFQQEASVLCVRGHIQIISDCLISECFASFQRYYVKMSCISTVRIVQSNVQRVQQWYLAGKAEYRSESRHRLLSSWPLTPAERQWPLQHYERRALWCRFSPWKFDFHNCQSQARLTSLSTSTRQEAQVQCHQSKATELW